MSDVVPTKTCARCKQTLPRTINYFPWISEHTNITGGRTKLVKANFYSYCCTCRRQQSRISSENRRRAAGMKPKKTFPVVDGFKECSKCEENQSVSEYYWNSTRQRYGAVCKSCSRWVGRERATSNRRAAGMKIKKTYPVVDGFKTCSSCVQSLPATREHFFWSESKGLYFSKCKACLKPGRMAYGRDYRNKPGYSEYQREWWVQNPERQKEYRVRWASDPDNKEAILLKGHRRRATLRGVTVGKVPRNIKSLLREAQDNRCHWCGKDLKRKRVHLDHFYPIAPLPGERQGSHSVENLAVACEHCNETKSNLQPETFASRIGLLFAPPPPFSQ